MISDAWVSVVELMIYWQLQCYETVRLRTVRQREHVDALGSTA